VTSAACWRLVLPALPASKRYDAHPFRSPFCPHATTATCSASRGLLYGTKLVMGGDVQYRAKSAFLAASNRRQALRMLRQRRRLSFGHRRCRSAGAIVLTRKCSRRYRLGVTPLASRRLTRSRRFRPKMA